MEKTPLIRLHDPHLASLTLAELKRYASTRDPTDLPSIPPTVPAPQLFHWRRLSRSQFMQYVAPMQNESDQFTRAFYLGCMRVTGPGRQTFEPDFARDSKLTCWQDEEIDQLELAPADILDIGHVIYTRSMLPKDCAPRYRLLPTSLDGWDGNALRYAAQTRSTAAPNNEPPKTG